MVKFPAWVKLKPLSTPQGQLVENEDPTISGEERVEIKGLVLTEDGTKIQLRMAHTEVYQSYILVGIRKSINSLKKNIARDIYYYHWFSE